MHKFNTVSLLISTKPILFFVVMTFIFSLITLF